MSACFTKALASFFEMMGVIVCILVAALLWLLTSLIFAVANSVFNIALVHANDRRVADGFREDVVQGAFKRNR
jgi:hypothetical protein